MNPKLILLIIKVVLWIIALGIGFFYMYSTLDGASIPYTSLTDFLTATGACSNGENCDISGTACFLCPYIENLLYLISNASVGLYGIILNHTWILLVFGFALYILFETYKTIKTKIEEATKLDEAEQKLDFKTYFEPIKKQGVRLLIVGALLGAFTINKTSAMSTMSKIVIEPVLSIGNYVAMKITNIPPEYCPTPQNEEEIPIPKFMKDNNLVINQDANILTSSLMNPFLCSIGNVNTILLAGASGGFTLMNLGWWDGSIFVWIAGFSMIFLFMVIGFNLIFDFMNIVLSLSFLIIFMPLIIASYAFKIPLFSNVGPTSVGILINAAANTILIALKVAILYVIILFPADKYFPGPLDGYTAVFPPEIAGFSLSETASNNLDKTTQTERPQIAEVLQKCSEVSKQSDGKMNKDTFKNCYQEAKTHYPDAFTWLDNSIDFFLMMIGVLVIYWTLIRKKIDEILGNKKSIFNFGDTVYDAGKKTGKSIGTVVKIFVKKVAKK